MKCHLCRCSLTPNSYANWELGKRKEVGFQCTNSGCASAHQAFGHRTVINLVLPDGEIPTYILKFSIDNIWYEIRGQKTQTVLSKMTINESFTSFQDTIITVPRIYPLNKDIDFKQQAEQIFTKLKSLNVFS